MCFTSRSPCTETRHLQGNATTRRVDLVKSVLMMRSCDIGYIQLGRDSRHATTHGNHRALTEPLTSGEPPNWAEGIEVPFGRTVSIVAKGRRRRRERLTGHVGEAAIGPLENIPCEAFCLTFGLAVLLALFAWPLLRVQRLELFPGNGKTRKGLETQGNKGGNLTRKATNIAQVDADIFAPAGEEGESVGADVYDVRVRGVLQVDLK